MSDECTQGIVGKRRAECFCGASVYLQVPWGTSVKVGQDLVLCEDSYRYEVCVPS